MGRSSTSYRLKDRAIPISARGLNHRKEILVSLFVTGMAVRSEELQEPGLRAGQELRLWRLKPEDGFARGTPPGQPNVQPWASPA